MTKRDPQLLKERKKSSSIIEVISPEKDIDVDIHFIHK